MNIPSLSHRCLYAAIRNLSREDLEAYAFGSAVIASGMMDLIAPVFGPGFTAAGIPTDKVGDEMADRIEAASAAVTRRTMQLKAELAASQN